MGIFAKHTLVQTTDSGIHVEDVRDDVPEFKRVYTATLGDRHIALKVTIHTFCGSRFDQGELTQPGGRWVMFDPKDPAEKILDRELVPLVIVACKEIFQLDNAFMKSNPGEYTDEKGQTWRRV